jgi:DNA-binding NtrC family response regulator
MGDRPPHEGPQGENLDQGQEECLNGTERILLVDDEKLLLEFTGELLTRFGYTPLFAENGECALEVLKAEAGRVDMVMLDLNMPGMGGFRCLQEMLEMDPTLKVLIASGYAATRKVNEARKIGAAGFIAKPYKHTDMLQKIREILDSRRPIGMQRSDR